MGPSVPQKRGGMVGSTKKGKGTKIMAITDSNGLPIGVEIESAQPHEVTLVTTAIKSIVLTRNIGCLIGDKAYDSDSLDKYIREQFGFELIAPNRKNKRGNKQDGRQLRRYKRRWKVERLFAWLQNFRRTITRFEYYEENFKAMILLACGLLMRRWF
jgi:transposase